MQVLLDVDEIIIPTVDDKLLGDMLGYVINRERTVELEIFDSYAPANFYFFLDNDHQSEVKFEVPKDFLFLQHIYRGTNISISSNASPKSFQNTDEVAVMHNHYPLHCMGYRPCRSLDIEKEYARLQHYRQTCPTFFTIEKCDELRRHTTKDAVLWRFKDKIIANVQETVSALKIFS